MARKGICRKCWPDGWPEGVFAAGCEHGSYERSKRLGFQGEGEASEESDDPDGGGQQEADDEGDGQESKE